MTEQQEMQVKKIFTKHCKNVNGFLTIDSNFEEGDGGMTDFDRLVEEVIHSITKK